MKKNLKKDTSGVLLVCSKKGLKKYSSNNIFNYDYPEGILPLITNGLVRLVYTEDRFPYPELSAIPRF